MQYDWYGRHEPIPNDDGHVFTSNEKSFDMNRIDMTSKVNVLLITKSKIKQTPAAYAMIILVPQPI